MIRTTSIASLLLLGGCALTGGGEAPPRPTAAQLDGGCEAMRPSFPITYHGGKGGLGGEPGTDTTETVRKVRLANAAFKGACP